MTHKSNFRIVLMFCALAGVLLSGCAATEADVEKIQIGMAKEQVKDILGEPQVAKDTAWIYHNIGDIESLHVLFRDADGKPIDRVSGVVRYPYDPQMRGEPR